MEQLRLHPPSVFSSPTSVASIPRGRAFTARAHSGPRLLKSQPRRSRRRSRRLSPPFDEDGDGDSDDNSSEIQYPVNILSSKENKYQKQPGTQVLLKQAEGGRQPRPRDGAQSADIAVKYYSSPTSLKPGASETETSINFGLSSLGLKSELNVEVFSRKRFKKMQEELDFDEKWFPLVEYLSTYGLKESDFVSIYERHMPSLQINLASAKERLEYLLNVGVKAKNMKRVLVRQPQILEYTVGNLKSHINFLVSIGVPDARIGQIIAAAPSLLSYSVDQSLKSTISYLMEDVGVKESDVGKMVQLSPHILVQRIDNSWTSRYHFLSKELRAPKDSIVKMVTKHPQLLHYSIEEGILPRINFFRSIGLTDSDVLKILTSLTQVLSLSLERNLKPKYYYLIEKLRNDVKSLTKYPMYLSLSLEQRIKPRHLFLVYLKKVPKGPFPLSSLVPTDEYFCQHWAGTSIDEYLTFRQRLLLDDLPIKQCKGRGLSVWKY